MQNYGWETTLLFKKFFFVRIKLVKHYSKDIYNGAKDLYLNIFFLLCKLSINFLTFKESCIKLSTKTLSSMTLIIIRNAS